MILSLIAALSDNYVIGKNKGMPWEMPADMAYFFKTTRHHHVVMGRRTFHEFGVSKPLPDRVNIIVSRQQDFHPPGVIVKSSLDEAIDYARKDGETEIFFIGGGKLYGQVIDRVDKMYLTFIHTTIVDGDTFFPRFDYRKWQTESEEKYMKDKDNPFDYTFTVLNRK